MTDTRVFEWLSDGDTYRMLGLESDSWPPLVQQLDGRSRIGTWKSPRITIVNPQKRLPASDIAVWETTTPPVVTEAAWSELRDLLEPYAEPLPLLGGPAPHVIVNVTRLVPALVEPESEVFRMPSGPIAYISRYVLDPAVLGPIIFKLKHDPTGNVLVLEPVVRRVAERGLTGARFRQVWP